MDVSDICIQPNQTQLSVSVPAQIDPTDISALSAYYTLRELFGPPTARPILPKSLWAYYFQVPHGTVAVHNWQYERWVIVANAKVDLSVAQKESIEEYYHRLIENKIRVREQNSEYKREHENLEQPNESLIKAMRAQSEQVGNEFLEFLRKHIQKASSRINKVTAQTKSFVLQNPFLTYYYSVEV